MKSAAKFAPSTHPMAVYRGQLVIVCQRHERTAVVLDDNETRLLVLASELKTDAASLVAAMQGQDPWEGQ